MNFGSARRGSGAQADAGRWPAVARAVLGFCALAPCRAAELPAPLDVSDTAPPAFAVFGAQEGLSDEIWNTVGFDAQGFVWAGSASEVARFDGYRFTPWPTGAKSLVRDMATDDAGTLWAVFEHEGIARHSDGVWTLVPLDTGFIQRFSETRDPQGRRTLWLGTERGLRRLVDGEWREDPGNAALPQGLAVATARTESLFGGPRQWLAIANRGLWYRGLGPGEDPAAWRRHEDPRTDAMQFTDLAYSVDDGAEEIWLVSYGHGLARLRAEGLRFWRMEDGDLPSEALYSALATYGRGGERSLWVSSRAGLLRVRGDDVTAYDRRHGLPSDAVRGIKLQRNGDGIDLLWLATERGVARAALTDSPWRTVSLLGARENGTFTLLLEPDGRGGERLWVGSAQRGIGLLERGRWRYFHHRDGTLPVAGGFRGTWRVPGLDGEDWRLFSLTGGVLLRVDDALRFTRLAVPWSDAADEAATVVLPRTNAGARELWFGTLKSGAHRLSADGWRSFALEGHRGPWTVLGLAEQRDAAGRSWLWAATSAGIARYDGGQWRALPAALGTPVDGYRGVSLLRFGDRTELWASSNRHGVVRLDVTDPAAIAMRTGDGVPPPPDPTVYSVLRDSRGRIYVCTNNGIQQLEQGAAGAWRSRVFRRRDGLVHDECNTNAQLVDAHNRYWAGTLGGLSMFDPALAAESAPTKPKPLVATSVRVDGSVRTLAAGEPLVLPAGTRELRVDFALLSGLRETESTYRSRLVGFDPAATAWTPEHSRSFTALAPGPYQLVVEARDWAGTTATPLALAIEVQPYWWQRGWVGAVAVALSLLALLGMVSLYNRNLRARQRALRVEVGVRTRELNAANERLTELSYTDPLTGVANRRRFTEALEGSLARAAAKRLPIGVIVVDVDHFKEYNDRHGHLAGDAALHSVAGALASATRGQDLVARHGGEEFACLMLDADVETVRRVAERMRALVEALPPRTLGNDTQTITLSAGFACRVPEPGEHAGALLREADAALYRAKRDGRNCVRD